jgi:hypothetical protein
MYAALQIVFAGWVFSPLIFHRLNNQRLGPMMLEELEKRLATAQINMQDAAALHSSRWGYWKGQSDAISSAIILLKKNIT